MSQADKSSQNYRPPILSAGFAAGAGYASHYFYELSQSGVGWAAVPAIGAGFVATRQIIRAVDDYMKLRYYKRKLRAFKSGAKHQGQSRFATLKELKQNQLVGNGNRGIFLGQLKGKEIWYDGENSGNYYAPSGAGKTSCSIIPTLLSATARTKKDCATATSFLLNDPAAEIYAVTEQPLRKAGYDVVVLSSWTDEVSKAIRKNVVDAGLNMHSSFDPKANPSIIRDEIKFRTYQLIPDDKPNTEEKTKFFYRGARSLIDCFSLREYANDLQPNWVSIHKQLMVSPAELNEVFIDCMETSAFGGYLASLASSLSGIMNGAPEQFAGYLGVAHQALEPYDGFSVVGKHVSGTGFDVNRFKSPEKPVAVFLIYPGKRSVTHQRMLNSEISYLLEMICSDSRHRRVTALIDEAAGIGYVPSLLRFLNEGRKHQLRIFSVWQDLSQAELIYGKAGMKQILAAGHFLWASGVREPEMARMLSQIAGTMAIEDMSLNDRAQNRFAMEEQAHSLANRGVPLIRDVRTELLSDEVLIFYRNLQTIKAKKVPYFKEPRWSRIAGKNPYAG